MEFQEQLERFRDWAFDMSGAWQKVMWAGLAILAGYLVGLVISRILVMISHRLGALRRRKRADGQEEKTADSIAVDILGSLIRAAGILAGIAVAAWVYGFPIETLESTAVNAGIAIGILVAAWFLGAWLGSRVRGFGEKLGRNRDTSGQTLFAFLASVVRVAALAIGLIAGLQLFGFPIASLVAVIGAAGLAIALALQDTLKAVAAGVIIAVFRPFRIGDFVKISNVEGTVQNITPFTTVLTSLDNKEIIVTNDQVWSDAIINFTAKPRRRLELIFSISYDDDIEKAVKIIREVFEADPRIHDYPAVWTQVFALGSSSVDIRVRGWCDTPLLLDVHSDMLRLVKQRFDAEGVTIPYPHQVEILKEIAPLRIRERQASPERIADERVKREDENSETG